mmetsp:Transcript_79012/g.245144  ORF Transcript_79012/g.245144 Transcript_79012/m.245144 type:complete len:210 (-) Transcript_79012:59-688(-)
MPIGPAEAILIPLPLKIVLYLELILFTPFSLQHFFGGFKPSWARMSPFKLAQKELWAGEMLNGVGAFVLMYMIFDALVAGTISRIEVEILFISHALWMGVVFSFVLPVWQIHLVNPHSWLTIGVWATAFHLARWWCLVLSLAIMLFGVYRNRVQVPRDVDAKAPMPEVKWPFPAQPTAAPPQAQPSSESSPLLPQSGTPPAGDAVASRV